MFDFLWPPPKSPRDVGRGIQRRLVAFVRAAQLRRSCDRVGRRAHCLGHITVVNEGTIQIGDRVALGGDAAPVQLAVGRGAILGIGDHVVIEAGASIAVRSLVTLGHRVRVGAHTKVCDFDDAPDVREVTLAERYGTMIGDDVLLGSGVTVMPGVRIGNRAVVPDNTVVDADIPESGWRPSRPAADCT